MSQTGQDRPSVLRAARERTRAEITRQILDAARRHLATEGASGLSLRAIARELGASSSAVYRYVASRDELLTRLSSPPTTRWAPPPRPQRQPWPATTRRPLVGGLRRRAGLGPGQPQRVRPDLRHAGARLRSPARHHRTRRPRLQRAAAHPRRRRRAPHPRHRRGRRAPRQPQSARAGPLHRRAPGAQRAAATRTDGRAALFGTVSFELFGQLHGIVGDQPGDHEAFFAESVRRWAAQVGITSGSHGPRGLEAPTLAGARRKRKQQPRPRSSRTAPATSRKKSSS